MKKFWIGLLSILLISNVVFAMGGSPPASPEAKSSKYKLEVLKMELVPASSVSELKVSGKKVLMVIAPKNFQDKEFSIPKGMLEKAGVKPRFSVKEPN